MIKKDPAFLFYPKDWLQGTSNLMPEEKGVYIDLLSHQHQNGDLPNDTKRLARMVGLSESEFIKIWEVLKDKFKLNFGKRLVNQKLNEVTNERRSKSATKKITGTFASVIRLSDAPNDIKEKIKNSFNYEDFLETPTNLLTVSLTNWFSDCLKSIVNANGIVTKDKIEGVGERKGFSQMPIATDKIFDILPSGQISSAIELIKITQQKDISNIEIISLWEVFKIQYLTGNKFYESIDKVYNHFNNWAKSQKFSNGQQSINGSHSGDKLGTSEARVKTARTW